MKALRLTAWKSDPELCEVAEPDPGRGQVRLRVAGAGACHSDLHLFERFAPGDLAWRIPFTIGHEATGWVDAVGTGVTSVEVGEPVAVYGAWGCGGCHQCRLGFEHLCERLPTLGGLGGGLGHDGAMAPYMLVPSARWLVPLGDVDPVTAAPLTDAALTPYHGIKPVLPTLGPGRAAVVVGAGGLGLFAVQLLRALSPAVVIAVDERPRALESARTAGADHVVLAGDAAADEVRDLTSGRGADLVVDTVGAAPTVSLAAAVIAPMGNIVIVGLGGAVLRAGFGVLPFDVSVSSAYWGTRAELVEVVELARTGHLRPLVRTFGLDEALDAYEAMRAGTLDGRAVITPNP